MVRIKSLFIALLVVLLAFNQSFSYDYIQPVEKTKMNSFVDVSSSDANLPFINYLSTQGIINGFADGTYQPRGYLTRAQAATVMVSALGISTEASEEIRFTDVPVTHWAHKAIGLATKVQLLQGFPDGTFRPDDNITRAQAIALILRLSGQDLPEIGMPLPKDIHSTHWATKAIGAACSAGLVELQNGKFNPDDYLTRGDMARALSVAMTLSPTTRSLSLAGELTVIKGSVLVKKSGEEQFNLVSSDKKIIINFGDSIRTNANSSAEIIFSDGSGLLLEPNVEMTIKESRGLAYIGRQGKPGNTVEWLNIDLKQGKMFVFLASIIPGEETETGREVPWWKEPFQQKVRVQINMPLGTGNMKNGVGVFEVKPQERNTIYNFIGQINMAAGKEEWAIKPGKAASILQNTKASQIRDMSKEELSQFLNDPLKTFLIRGSNVAIANGAVDIYDKKDAQVSPVKQQEILMEALRQAGKTSNSSATSGGGSGGGSGALTEVSRVTVTPTPGAVSAGTSISLSTTTTDAKIYYTLDGSIPNQSSSLYTNPIIINSNTTIKAIAVKSGMKDSIVETFNYTMLNPTAPSNNAALSSFALSVGGLTPAFDASILNYTVVVANAVSSIIVTPTVSDSNATTKVNGIEVNSGYESDPIAINVGSNEIRIVVTAEDGTTTKAYTLMVTRESAPVIPPDPTGSWVPVGDRGISEGSVESTSFYISQGVPYQAYTSGFSATVKRFTEDGWKNVGEADFSTGTASSISLAVDGGTPYVAYLNTSSGNVIVEKYDGAQWGIMGGQYFTGNGSHSPNLFIDGGIPYVAYTRNAHNGKAVVQKYDDGWVGVGASGFSAPETHSPQLYVDNGVPYLAYQDGWHGPVTVMKYDGTNWMNVGEPGFSTGAAYGITLSVHNGTPYVAYQDGEKGPVAVKKFDGTSWTEVTRLNFTRDAQDVAIKIVSPDSIYMAYQDGENAGKATVYQYNGTNWVVLGDPGFTPYRVQYLSIDVHENTPYISFREGYDGITQNPLLGRVTVMKFLNTHTVSKTSTPTISNPIIKSGDNDIAGIAEPYAEITMTRGVDRWETVADNNGSFMVSLEPDERLGGFDEIFITAHAPGKSVSEPATIIVQYSGSGTVVDPYEIWTLGELNGIRYNLSAHYKLQHEIEAEETIAWNEGKGWEPIGTWDDPFTGTIDGDGLHIYGLFINRDSESHVGLVGVTKGAAIRDLGVYIYIVKGFEHVGGLVGFNEDTPIDKCYAVTAGATGTVLGKYIVGGLVGTNKGTSMITECFSDVEVLGEHESDCLGGLIGKNNGAAGVSSSYATGNVTGWYAIGGLIGENVATPITNSYATGVVTGVDCVGGLVGSNQNSAINNSFALNRAVVRSEYDSRFFGKVVGADSGVTTYSVFALDQMIFSLDLGVVTGVNGDSITFIQARQPSTYVGWDFAATWKIEGGNPSYPHLRNIYTAQNAGTGEIFVMTLLLEEIEEVIDLENMNTDNSETEYPIFEDSETTENVVTPIATPTEGDFEEELEIYLTPSN